jgi:hypothetical protein
MLSGFWDKVSCHRSERSEIRFWRPCPRNHDSEQHIRACSFCHMLEDLRRIFHFRLKSCCQPLVVAVGSNVPSCSGRSKSLTLTDSLIGSCLHKCNARTFDRESFELSKLSAVVRHFIHVTGGLHCGSTR